MVASKRIVDFTNVKDGGQFNPKHKVAGDYKAKVASVEDAKSKEGNEMWVFTVTLPGDSTASYPYRCLFADNQLWKIRNLFVAAGIQVPKKKVNVDPSKLVNKFIGVTLEDDEYEGKMKSVITATFPSSDLDDDTPVATTKTTGKKAAPSTSDDDVSDDDLDEMDLEEL